MSEIRLYVTTTETGSAAILSLLDDEFGEDDVAIASMEIDERNDVWEVSVYATRDEESDFRDRFSTALARGPAGLDINREVLPDIDWIAKSLEGLKPVRAGRFVVHGSHDRDTVRPNDFGILIDAGQAFGTGHHGTTAGCLEMIHSVMRAGKVTNVLDLGTGSGVLAIAARKMKPAPVLATDIDPVATRVARANVRANEIASGIRLATAPGFHSPVFRRQGPFDLIIANILARPLIKLAPELVRHLAPGGTVILSGILASQRWKVLSAYNGVHLAHIRTIWRNGWVTIVLTRKQMPH